jgi:hypothetical protein
VRWPSSNFNHLPLTGLVRSVRHRIAQDTAGARSSRLTIEKDDMRLRVFDPVLAAIFGKLDQEVDVARRKEYLLLSGALGECPYVHTYMKDQFDAASKTIEILETNDECVSY